MTHVVKPFNTATRRFHAGAAVSEADDLAPHSFADLKTRGFIAAKDEKKKFDPLYARVAKSED